MKVRIGVAAGLGTASDPALFGPMVDDLDRLGFDSIWIPDVFTAQTYDPLTALSFVAGRVDRLKIGTHLAIPGRNPIRLAKELATLDRLSEGRLLLTFVLGLADPLELAAGGVPRADRGTYLEETLEVLRALWTGAPVTFHGQHFHYDEMVVHPTPQQEPLEVWLGGMVPGALRRCGRIADGWIPGIVTPEQAAEAKAEIDAAATEAGRIIDIEHFGVNVTYRSGPLSDAQRDGLAKRNKGASPEALIPAGFEALHTRMEEFVEVGFSKFIVRPSDPPAAWEPELERLAEGVLDLVN